MVKSNYPREKENWRFKVLHRLPETQSGYCNDAHPLPRINDILDSLGDAQYFSALDLRSAYWQISVDEQDRPKTAFATPNRLYEFKRMPFGLFTAPATFQRVMEIALAGLTFTMCLCYLDDVIFWGEI